ncbi:ribonuclease H2, subunit B [Neohortaea acidophila]|uniref:Ribonuclease H2 subunit B n=1 Tax=Neohortaea acidophila TaxID=245834 RepID=A0A6A6Q6N1_9PEZI|nr:ribonuclease H2, subunit B [Neohortaea acidophila]KAF2487731.1 ribonuclease H2, subunit B [Neohortaea acidophila]
MKTRTRKAAGPKGSQPEPTTSTIKTLEPSVPNAPQLFILPKDLSPDARIISLPNPATSKPCRYLACPTRGCFEFTRVSAPKRACRSWLLAPEQGTLKDDEDGEGYVLQTPDLMLATPVDPVFLLLPALVEDAQESGRQYYLSLSDYLQRLIESSPHLKDVLNNNTSRRLERIFESRIKQICDSMDDGQEMLYMLSKLKLLEVLLTKAKKMVEMGLPATMDEKFVRQALVAPVLSIRREDSSISVVDADPTATTTTQGEASTSQDSQSTAHTESTSATTTTSVSSAPSTTDEEIQHLLRIRTAFTFLLRSYVPESLHASLTSLINKSDSSGTDFTPLDTHLAHLDKLRKEAQTLRSLSDNISRKRSALDDEEAMEKAEAKKRKKEEEELKKKSMSRGVKALEKVDRSGMKTLSSFFGKATAKGK